MPKTKSPRLGRPRQDEVERREDELLAAAARVFSRDGFGRTTIAKIAAESGASTKTLYARYENKADLLVDLVKRHTRTSLDELHGILGDASLTPAAVLEAVGMRIARHWLSSLEVGLYRIVYAEGIHHPPLLRAFREVTAPFDELLATYFARLHDDGVLVVDDPLAFARQYMHLAAGEILERALLDEHPTEEEARRDVRRAVAIMTASLRAPR